MGIIRELLIKLNVLGGPESRTEIDATTASLERLAQAQTATGAGPATPASGDAAAVAEAQAAATEKVTAALAGEETALGQVSAAQAAVAAAGAATASSAEASTAAMQGEAAAVGAVTAALTGQAAAAKEVETILELKARIAQELVNKELDAQGALQQAFINVRLRIQELGEATTVGGKAMTAAMLEARDAVAALEVQMASASAVNKSLVSPAMTAELAAYDMRMAALAATTETTTAATAALRAEAQIASGSVGGLARGLANMGGVLGTVLIPLLLLPAAIELLVRGFQKIDEWSKAGAASLVNWVLGLNDADLATRRHGESLEAWSARLKTVADAQDDAARAAKAMSAGVIQQTADVAAGRVEWQGYEAALHGSFDQYPEFTKALKEMGVTFRATHEEMLQRAIAFGNAYAAELKKDGIDQANAWASANKAVLDRIISDFQRAGVEVPATLKKLADGMGLVTTATKEFATSKELHDKLTEDASAFEALEKQVSRLTVVFGSEKAAAEAMAPVIEKLTTDLKGLQTTNAADEASRQAMLKWLAELAAKYGLLEGAVKQVVAAGDKAVASFSDQKLKLAELNREYDNHVKSVTAAADKSIAAINREADAVRTSLQNQIVELRKEHDEGLIENSAYNEKISLLAAAANLAADAAQKERELINAKEQDDLERLAERHRETAGKIAEAQKKITDEAAEAAKGIQKSAVQISTDIDAMKERVAESLRSIQEQIANTGQSFVEMATKAAAASRDVVPPLRDIGQVASELGPKMAIGEEAANALVAKLKAMEQSGNFATTALAKISEGVLGLARDLAELPGLLHDVASSANSTFDAGAGATPGSEGF